MTKKIYTSKIKPMKIASILVLAICIAACSTSITDKDYRMVAEFEPTEYLILSFRAGTHEMGSVSDDTLTVALLNALTPHVKVLFIYKDTAQLSFMKSKLFEWGLDTVNIVFMYSEAKGGGAITDKAPLILANGKGELATINFGWGCYGLLPPGDSCTIRDGDYDVMLAKDLNVRVLGKSNLVWEGGAKENNSKGTLLLVEQLELQRNPGFTKEQIEQEHISKLNLKKVIWLKKGVIEDDMLTVLPGGYYPVGCGGHVDEFCRFVNDSTIMLAITSIEESKTDSIALENYKRMEENHEILKNATDQDGKPFHIIRVPVAEISSYEMKYEDILPWYIDYYKGTKPGQTVKTIAASSYLNFIIANDVVVTAKYWKEGRSEASRIKDEKVYEIFTKAFPSKKIIQIDMEGYNTEGGGMHCYSYNLPFGTSLNKK